MVPGEVYLKSSLVIAGFMPGMKHINPQFQPAVITDFY
jgi:hypothetical protein